MGGENKTGVLIILAILAIALFGGFKNAGNTGNTDSSATSTPTTLNSGTNKEQQIKDTQNKIDSLEKQLQIEESKVNDSQYKGIVTLNQVSQSNDANKEFITISISGSATTTIPVTGWKLKSLSTGNQVIIPKGTYLFFAGMINTEDNIYLQRGEILYLVTGISPNGASFKTNKCSGYLSQFQTFVPYLSTSCPLPKDEDLSSIPKTVRNDSCFDYIDAFPRCRIQATSLPLGLSQECTNFILNKINYPSCVDTHKNDADFYGKDWRVYLKRSSTLWKTRRETIVLYDNDGKIVSTLNY